VGHEEGQTGPLQEEIKVVVKPVRILNRFLSFLPDVFRQLQELN